jgi:hypothetical protein
MKLFIDYRLANTNIDHCQVLYTSFSYLLHLYYTYIIHFDPNFSNNKLLYYLTGNLHYNKLQFIFLIYKL